MSLLGRGEPFIAYPSTDDEGEFGAKKRIPGNPNGTGVSGRAQFTRPGSDTVVVGSYGDDETEDVVLSTSSFPFGKATVVRWPHDSERLWDVTDEPLVRRGGSPATHHVSASLSARTGVPR